MTNVSLGRRWRGDGVVEGRGDDDGDSDLWFSNRVQMTSAHRHLGTAAGLQHIFADSVG